MARVSIVCVFGDQRQRRPGTMDEAMLKKRSATLKALLEDIPTPKAGKPKEVVLRGSFGPMAMVLNTLQQYGNSDRFRVNIRGMANTHVAMLYEVCEMLQIDPVQTHLEDHVRQWASHNKLSAEDLMIVHRIFWATRDVARKDEKLTTWRVMVHQVAFNIEDGQLSDAEMDATEATIRQRHPELADGITSRIQELKRNRGQADRQHERREEKKATKAINRKVAAHKSEQRARQREELQGDVREIGEGTRNWVLTRRPPLNIETKEGKHGKRNPPGQGKRAPKNGTQGSDGLDEEA